MDFAALQAALEEARRRGDREAMRRLVTEIETEDLPTEDPGEVRRMRFRGAPAEQYTIEFAPGGHPPSTFPADLPWVAGARTTLLVLGPAQPVTAMWSGVDATATMDRIVAESVAAGWEELPGLKLATASGVRPVFLQRGGVVRHLVAVAKPEGGMVQLMQATPRTSAGEGPGGTGAA